MTADVSVAPPPLLDGIVRVKVPADKILPFLAKSNLFKSCDKTVVGKVATLLQGLECAEGSELVTHGKVNDGIGILFSGKAQVLMPTSGGELLPVEDLEPVDHFGEVPAQLVGNLPFLPVKPPGNVLTLAMVTPRDHAALAEVKRTLSTVEIIPVAVGLEDFNSAIVRLKLDDSGGGKARTASGAARINPDSFQFEIATEQD